MDVRPAIVCLHLVALIGLAGCQKDREAASKNPPAFPTILEVGDEITLAAMGTRYPGTAAYLSALQERSNVPLLQRVQNSSPHYETIDDGEGETPAWSIDATMDWGPYRAVLITYGRFHKQVILDLRDGRYHLLLLDTDSWREGSLEVIPADGRQVLVYRADYGGNAGCEAQGYFVLDDQAVPMVVEVKHTVHRAAERALPEDFSVWNWDGFDIRNLHYENDVWGPKDCHASPTGGQVSIDFDLVGHELIVKGSHYEPGPTKTAAGHDDGGF